MEPKDTIFVKCCSLGIFTHNPDETGGTSPGRELGSQLWLKLLSSAGPCLGPTHHLWDVECLIDEVLKIIWKYR